MPSAIAPNARVALLAALIGVLWSTPASSQDVGDIVVVVADDVDVMENGKMVAWTYRGDCLRIDEIDGESYRVHVIASSGWINRKDVIRFDQAIEYFTIAIRDKPIVRDYVCRARIWTVKGEIERAMRDLDEAVRTDPADAYGYASRASTWLSRGMIDKAIADQTKVIRLNSEKSPWALSHSCFERAHSYLYKGEYDQAVGDFTEAIRFAEGPAASLYYGERAMALLANGDHDKALADCEEVVRLEPDRPWGYCCRGRAWSSKGEYDKALADFNDAVRLGPEAPKSVRFRSWFRATCPEKKYRNGSEAIEDAKKMLELWGDWRELPHYLHDVLGAAYAEMGDFENAIKWQEKALAYVSQPYHPERISGRDKDEYSHRLALYKAGKAYRDEPKSQRSK